MFNLQTAHLGPLPPLPPHAATHSAFRAVTEHRR